MNTSIRICTALFLLLTTMMLEAKESRSLPLRAFLGGQLTLTPSGTDSITIEATMRGFGTPFGPAQAVATWTTTLEKLASLQSGAVSKITIGNGTLLARSYWGTISGNFSGTLRRLRSGEILFESEYSIVSGTGLLQRTGGSGKMLGVANQKTLAFQLYVSGSLTNRQDTP